LFPLKKPDFVISLGTGESNNLEVSADNSPRKKSPLRRLGELIWEKCQDKQIREAIQTRPAPKWYHRINLKFDGMEPRLDDTSSMVELKSKAENDQSVSELIDNAARCVMASLFYFELDSIPQRSGENYVGSGRILCTLRRDDPALQVLINQLSTQSAQFLLNDCPISLVDDPSCFSKDGNFRKEIELDVADGFTVSLQQGHFEPWNISGSPFSVKRLVVAQGLEASFGTSDHRKRKASDLHTYPIKKRRCM